MRTKNNEITKRFGRNLRDIMHALDINGTELAKKTGLSTACVCLAKNGKREPSLSTAVRIAQAVSCTVERLLK